MDINILNTIVKENGGIIKNLNEEPGKEIYIGNFCGSSIINKFFIHKREGKKLVDLPYLDPKTNFVFVFVPKTTKLFINLFCCGTTMTNVYKKLDKYGLAVEGCFDIEPLSRTPRGLLSAIDINDKMIKKNIKSHLYNDGYLLIDNHKTLKIVDSKEILSYKTTDISMYYIQGLILYKNGEPFIPINRMKDIIIKGVPGLVDGKIDGSNVVIDYQNLKIKIGSLQEIKPRLGDKINGTDLKFSDIGSRVKFVDNDFFELSGFLVIGIDKNGNIIIFYHPRIDFYNIMLVLNIFNCDDAILICKSPSIHLMWKENGLNTYNKTNFIGNPGDIISNVITFSSS